MAIQWKQNEANLVAVDLAPYDIYAESAGFTLHYKLKGDVNTTDSGATWTEVIHNIGTAVTFNTSGITASGSGTVEFTGELNGPVTAGMVFQAGGTFIYVSSVSGSTITLRRVTTSEIADATAFTQVGNTGLYETDVTLATLGQYTIIISNPSVGLLNEASKVEVVANTIDDLSGDLASHDTAVNNKLDDISSALGVVDTSISGNLIL